MIREIQVPENLRPRDHINQLLKLDEENEEKERAIQKVSDIVLRDLKKLYDNAIQPLETLYKYRDLSNRHFGGKYPYLFDLKRPTDRSLRSLISLLLPRSRDIFQTTGTLHGSLERWQIFHHQLFIGHRVYDDRVADRYVN